MHFFTVSSASWLAVPAASVTDVTTSPLMGAPIAGAGGNNSPQFGFELSYWKKSLRLKALAEAGHQ